MTQPSTSLLDAVLTLADADDDTPDEVKYLVLAALDGDAALADAVGDRYEPPAPSATAAEPAPEPVGAFLRSICVGGFRGVGPEQTLQLHPAPGLTVVAGRNGSGKSTFAEALEVCLTRTSYRWRERTAGWLRNWANLHTTRPRCIRVGLAEEHVGATEVGVDWPAATEKFDDMRSWVQRAGGKREDGLDSLGWAAALDLYRPILSYEELGGLLTAEPKKLYEALAGILGLEQLTHAQARLDSLRAETSATADAARSRGTALKKTLAESDDERAAEALRQLRKRSQDLAALRDLATGSTSTPPRTVTLLRALADVELPDQASVERVADELTSSVGGLADTADDAADRATRRLTLLRQAVELHDRHGADQPCPVCGTGVLDAGWRSATETELARHDTDEHELTRARNRLVRARAAARSLVDGTAPLVSPSDVPLASLDAAVAAHTTWSTAPDGDLELAAHLGNHHAQLVDAVGALRTEAAAALSVRQDAWAPLATQLATWVELAEKAAAEAPLADRVTDARNWLRNSADAIRNNRLEPLADDARRIWAALRQESNVDLKKITLNKVNESRRHVVIEAEVDGTDAGALGVMSTGELHALALALFLPRATRPESPFRFVVLDDPIQAMDPSKIDGLVTVLAEQARTRQVIVFSHDDRLPEAVRRLVPDARVLAVTRSPGSVVDIDDAQDPAQRDLEDARAFVRDPSVPLDLLTRVVPRLCRSAVETAARDAYFARAFTAGTDRHTVESTWDNARTQPARIALALFAAPNTPPDRWLDAKPYRRAALRVCGAGNHGALRSNPTGAVADVGNLVRDLRRAR